MRSAGVCGAACRRSASGATAPAAGRRRPAGRKRRPYPSAGVTEKPSTRAWVSLGLRAVTASAPSGSRAADHSSRAGEGAVAATNTGRLMRSATCRPMKSGARRRRHFLHHQPVAELATRIRLAPQRDAHQLRALRRQREHRRRSDQVAGRIEDVLSVRLRPLQRLDLHHDLGVVLVAHRQRCRRRGAATGPRAAARSRTSRPTLAAARRLPPARRERGLTQRLAMAQVFGEVSTRLRR